MKTPSSDLHELVHSLSNKEVKGFCASMPDAYQHLMVFDVIKKQQEYSEEELTKLLPKEISKSLLATLKYDLHNRILAYLKLRRKSSSDRLTVISLLESADILANKGLLQQAQKKINKANSICINAELKAERLLVTEIQHELAQLTTNVKIQSDFVNIHSNEILAELEEIDKHIRLQKDYDFLYLAGDTRILDPNNENIRNKLKELEKYKNEKFGPRTAILYYQTIAMALFRLGEKKKTVDQLNRVLTIYDANPILKQNQFNDYLKVRMNLVSVVVRENKLDREKEVLSVIELIEKNKSKKAIASIIYREVRAYVLLAEIYQVKGKYRDGLLAVQKGKEICKKHNLQMLPLHKIIFDFMEFQAHFALGNFSKSLIAVNDILNEDYNGVRPDIKQFCRIAFLIIHYELQNFEELRYYLDSANRYYKGKNNLIKTEILIIKLLKQLIGNKNNMQKVVLAFKADLDEMTASKTDISLKLYFNFEAWADNLMERT